MNADCYACQQPASRICRHLECDFPAFYCDGPCHNNVSKMMHNHGGQSFVDFAELEKSIATIRRNVDTVAQHQDFINGLKKRIEVMAGKFQQLIEDLNKGLKELEKDLSTHLKVQLNQINQVIFDKVKDGLNNVMISGKQINVLLTKQNKYKNQKKVFGAIQVLKKDFESVLKEVEEFNVKKYFISYTNNLEQTKILLEEGTKFEKNKKYGQALTKFNQAILLNPSEGEIYFKSGFCSAQLKKYDDAKRSFLKSNELNPDVEIVLYYLGLVCQKRNQFQDAVKYYSQAINKNTFHEQALVNRGNCYVELKKYKQASLDFISVNSINPELNIYAQKIMELAKEMNTPKMPYGMGNRQQFSTGQAYKIISRRNQNRP